MGRKMIYLDDAIDALMNSVTPYGIMDDDGNIESGCKDKDIVAMLYNLPSAQPSDDYERGWHDGRKALREEIWEDDRDRLD